MKHDIYKKFGDCWNKADFSSFSKKLLRDCTFESFDYFYKLKGKDRLTEFFDGLAKNNLTQGSEDIVDVHRGYCQKTSSLLKTIRECCIMVRRSDLKTVNVLVFNKKFGKISSVVGMDPQDIKSIRDTRI